MRGRHSNEREGFTMIELIVVVSLVGLVAVALAASISVFVRNQGSVSSRLTDTRDLQNLTNYLPGDVASAQLVESDLSPNQPADEVEDPGETCGAGGPVLLHLQWSENWTESYENRVTYRVLPPSGSDSERVVRFACENSGSPTQIKIAEAYQSVAVSLQRDAGDLTGTVEVLFTYPDGESRRITATSRHFLP